MFEDEDEGVSAAEPSYTGGEAQTDAGQPLATDSTDESTDSTATDQSVDDGSAAGSYARYRDGINGIGKLLFEGESLDSFTKANVDGRFKQLAETLKTQRESLDGLRASEGIPTLKFDAPIAELDLKTKLNDLAANPDTKGYYDALVGAVKADHLAEIVPEAIANFDNMPAATQQAVAQAISTQIQSEIGYGLADLKQLADAYRSGQLVPAGQATPTTQPAFTPSANGSYGQQSQVPFSAQLIAQGYAADDPAVMAVRQQEQTAREAEQRYARLESRLDAITGQTKQAQEVQAKQAEAQRETEFKTKVTAVWDSLIQPLKASVPQGHERTLSAIKAEGRTAVEADPKAQLSLRRAQAYYQQGSQSQGDREFAAYSARAAILMTDAATYHLGLVRDLAGATRKADKAKGSRIEMPTGSAVTNGGRIGRPALSGLDPDALADAAALMARDRLPHLFGGN